MKTLYTILVFIFLLTTAQAQEITATLSGNTSTEGFSVNDNTPTTLFTVRGDGNVGIGTMSPGASLDLWQSSTTSETSGLRIVGASGVRWLSMWVDANYRSRIESGSGGQYDLILNSGGGNVGIGTTNPGASLDLWQSSTTSETSGLRIVGASGVRWLSMWIDANYRSRIESGSGGQYDLILNSGGGNVGIGTTSPGNILTIQQSSTTDPVADAWTIYSSKRWKENIKPLERSLDKVQRMRGVSFNWKANGKQDIGLIAEEVGEVIPEVVTYEENGIDAQSVDYARLVSVLIEAVKEQQKQIEELKEKINSLAMN